MGYDGPIQRPDMCNVHVGKKIKTPFEPTIINFSKTRSMWGNSYSYLLQNSGFIYELNLP